MSNEIGLPSTDKGQCALIPCPKRWYALDDIVEPTASKTRAFFMLKEVCRLERSMVPVQQYNYPYVVITLPSDRFRLSKSSK